MRAFKRKGTALLQNFLGITERQKMEALGSGVRRVPGQHGVTPRRTPPVILE